MERSRDTWTREEERWLGDRLQDVIRHGRSAPTDEGAAARRIMDRASEGWPSYTPGDGE